MAKKRLGADQFMCCYLEVLLEIISAQIFSEMSPHLQDNHHPCLITI